MDDRDRPRRTLAAIARDILAERSILNVLPPGMTSRHAGGKGLCRGQGKLPVIASRKCLPHSERSEEPYAKRFDPHDRFALGSGFAGGSFGRADGEKRERAPG